MSNNSEEKTMTQIRSFICSILYVFLFFATTSSDCSTGSDEPINSLIVKQNEEVPSEEVPDKEALSPDAQWWLDVFAGNVGSPAYMSFLNFDKQIKEVLTSIRPKDWTWFGVLLFSLLRGPLLEKISPAVSSVSKNLTLMPPHFRGSITKISQNPRRRFTAPASIYWEIASLLALPITLPITLLKGLFTELIGPVITPRNWVVSAIKAMQYSARILPSFVTPFIIDSMGPTPDDLSFREKFVYLVTRNSLTPLCYAGFFTSLFLLSLPFSKRISPTMRSGLTIGATCTSSLAAYALTKSFRGFGEALSHTEYFKENIETPLNKLKKKLAPTLVASITKASNFINKNWSYLRLLGCPAICAAMLLYERRHPATTAGFTAATGAYVLYNLLQEPEQKASFIKTLIPTNLLFWLSFMMSIGIVKWNGFLQEYFTSQSLLTPLLNNNAPSSNALLLAGNATLPRALIN